MNESTATQATEPVPSTDRTEARGWLEAQIEDQRSIFRLAERIRSGPSEERLPGSEKHADGSVLNPGDELFGAACAVLGMNAFDVEIPVFRNDEDPVGLDRQAVGDQLDRHRGVARQNRVQLGRKQGDVVDDHDRHPQVGRQALQQADVGIQATG